MQNSIILTRSTENLQFIQSDLTNGRKLSTRKEDLVKILIKFISGSHEASDEPQWRWRTAQAWSHDSHSAVSSLLSFTRRIQHRPGNTNSNRQTKSVYIKKVGWSLLHCCWVDNYVTLFLFKSFLQVHVLHVISMQFLTILILSGFCTFIFL